MTEIAPGSGACVRANIDAFLKAVGAGAVRDVASVGMRRASVTVVLPTRNEARNLPHVAERMPPVDEIVVIDGGSSDGTADVARELWPHATVIEQTRKGKGNALACGFRAATGDIIVMIDGDGSTDPAEIPRFVDALLGGADLAKGTRFRGDGGSDDITSFRRIGNLGLNWLVNCLFGTEFSDLCYGYNAFWRRNLECLDLPATDLTAPQWGDGFEIETVINVRAARSGWLIREVNSFEGRRIYGRSNLNAVTDGLRVLRTIRREQRKHRAAAHAVVGAGWSP
ncbi:glycosyltransferase family 2 protein [Mycolicibacterium austroafricanum]|uniref:glycosyltransferase family 2 protein n=1 Tax=Mycolicibacterium austroafricanum TaxID=39687 RepID=UPI0005611B6C|nr:glycosyltransferase family 2 protein [Mycolicibacterium austroafricanum]QZY48671.1 glycosyltransferase family 2 protein [Mycolicibacterium austroafricanum]